MPITSPPKKKKNIDQGIAPKVTIKSIEGKRITRDPNTGQATSEESVSISADEARKKGIIVPAQTSPGAGQGIQKRAAQEEVNQADIAQTTARREEGQAVINQINAAQAAKDLGLFQLQPQQQAAESLAPESAAAKIAGNVATGQGLASGGAIAAGGAALGVPVIGTAAGAIIAAGRITLGDRKDVKKAATNYQVVKGDFGRIIDRLNTDPTYGIDQAAEDWIAAEDTMQLAEINLRKKSQSVFGRELTNAESDLIKVQHFNDEILPGLRAQFDAALLTPNPNAQATQLPNEGELPLVQ